MNVVGCRQLEAMERGDEVELLFACMDSDGLAMLVERCLNDRVEWCILSTP